MLKSFLKVDSQWGPTVHYRGLRSVLCGGLDGRLGGERKRVCVAESYCRPPETVRTLSALLLLYSSIKEKVWKRFSSCDVKKSLNNFRKESKNQPDFSGEVCQIVDYWKQDVIFSF